MMVCRASRSPFGAMPGGGEVEAITLANDGGMQVRLITLGASIQAVLVPDRHGTIADVALGFSTVEPYLEKRQYFGSTVGRVANRIAGGRFRLDGREYQVPVNDGPNALHGGCSGFDLVNWTLIEVADGPPATAVMRHVSPDGDQGFPGTLVVTATYRLDPCNTVSVEYVATTDAPTLVNISSHAYWNLAGEGSASGAMDHRLMLAADHYLPTEAASIPTGEIRPVDGTLFDFRRPTVIGERVRDATDEQIRFGRGYDHNWVAGRGPFAEPSLLAQLEDPLSGRVMQILSNQPGIQFYSGNFLDATSVGKAGRLYRMGDAVALEPQMFPDTPNRPQFGSVRLEPGQHYRNEILWRFSTDAAVDEQVP